MIPVAPRPEPPNFDALVRNPGIRWKAENNLDLHQPPPRGKIVQPYWRACLGDLYREYNGICAYLAVHFERTTGAGSVDHFAAKSRVKLSDAYEWDNYRLVCLSLNRNKREFDDVLDPFQLAVETFHLELVTGRIFPNPSYSATSRRHAEKTIRRLHLDDPNPREMRARHYQEYCEGEYTNQYLQRRSPFVWYEANRQGLL